MAEAGFHADLDRPGRTLLIAFGGLMGSVGAIPVFEFFSLVERENPEVKRLFVRDLKQAWYQLGVAGVGDTAPEVAAWLRELVAGLDVERTVGVGASAGGFGALLFGALAGLDEVHAFGPQTFLDRRRRALHRERRNREEIAVVNRIPRDRPVFRDLRPVLAGASTGSRYVIHYSARNRLDVIHARRLRRLPGVELRPHPFAEHNVVGVLRERGELPALLNAIVSGASSPPKRPST